MRMIEKEASKTPASSPRVESYIIGNISYRAVCLSHPAPPPTSSRNTGSCSTSSPTPSSQLTKSATRENVMEGPKGPGPHPFATLGPLPVPIHLGRLRVGSAVQTRQDPTIQPRQGPASPPHRSSASGRCRAAAAAPRAPPHPTTAHTLRPRTAHPAHTAVRRAGRWGAASPAAPNRRGARAPSSLLLMCLTAERSSIADGGRVMDSQENRSILEQ